MANDHDEHALEGQEEAARRRASDATASSLSEDGGDASGPDTVPEHVAHYRLEEEIGRGGMGIVYRGLDTRLDRKVAVKVLPLSMGQDGAKRARFQREAKLLALVDHPNIAAIHAIEELEGRPFLILEFVEGRTLSRERQGATSITQALELCLQVAEAMEAAHARDVIHRDLKPANIMVTPEGRIKVLDFGLAKLSESSEDAPQPDSRAGVEDPHEADVTRVGAIVGTVSYMPPEQLRGHPVDGRCDIWAFGCILFELLADERIWGDESSSERVNAILCAEPEWDKLPAGTPAPVRQLLERCLQKERSLRLRHFSDARLALEAGLESSSERKDAPHAFGLKRGNLPRENNSVIGRETDVRAIDALLDDSRLVTLTGMGGCGKTRLALATAATRAPRQPDHAWWIDLAGLDEATAPLQSLAVAVGAIEGGGVSLLQAVVRRLRAGALLVFDNCEQLLQPVADLTSELLRTSETLSILATSRQALGVSGEQLYAVAPLPCPNPEQQPSLDELRQSPAVQLFLERGKLASPSFELNEDNATAIAQICHRLDGFPLALELAAARLRLLSANQLVDRLADRFKLLRAGKQAAGERHGTLLSVLTWSLDQLEEDEALFFRRLTTFPASFSLETAEAVCTDSLIPSDEALDLLTSLLDHSLVVTEHHHDVVRYRLLETVREYGRELLVAAGEASTWDRRHREYVSGLAAAALKEVDQPDEPVMAERLDRALPDIRKAIGFCIDTADQTEQGLHIACDLVPYWKFRGAFSEARQHLERLIEAGRTSVSRAVLGRALGALGYVLDHIVEFEKAVKLYEEAAAIAEELDSDDGRVRAWRGLASVEFRLGKLAEAEQYCDQALELARNLGDDHHVVGALTTLSALKARAGEHAAAIKLARECLQYYEGLGSTHALATAESNLAAMELGAGNPEGALVHGGRAADIRTALGDERGLIRCYSNLGAAHNQLGNDDEAREHHEEALRLGRAMRDREALAVCANNLAYMALEEGDLVRARALFSEALRTVLLIKDKFLTIHFVDNLGRTDLRDGKLKRAAQLFGAATQASEELGINRTEDDLKEHEGFLAELRDRLGEDELTALLKSGAGLGLPAAAVLALEGAPDGPSFIQ